MNGMSKGERYYMARLAQSEVLAILAQFSVSDHEYEFDGFDWDTELAPVVAVAFGQERQGDLDSLTEALLAIGWVVQSLEDGTLTINMDTSEEALQAVADREEEFRQRKQAKLRSLFNDVLTADAASADSE